MSSIENNLPNIELFQEEIAKMTLSASGWRKIFAHTQDAEAKDTEIREIDHYLAAAVAYNYAQFFLKQYRTKERLILAQDARPTGAILTAICYKVFKVFNIDVKFLGITTLPEVVAETRSKAEVKGYFYVSASHNPVGHNGFKFSFDDGTIVGGETSRQMIKAFRELFSDKQQTFFLFFEQLEIASVTMPKIDQEYQAIVRQCYFENIQTTFGDNKLITAIKRGLKTYPLGIVVDFNGSARSKSIDLEFLQQLGIKTAQINGEAGAFAHRIVPEGESLEPCCEFLAAQHLEKKQFLLGYVPDCDGDRGNLVYYSHYQRKATWLEAQTGFALSCLAELCYLAWLGQDMERVAIVANCATSLRIDELCEVFGAKMFNSEVGEANVVLKAQELHEKGYVVRICGEGSNGGSIIYPGVVRDPLSTLSGVIKLLTIRGNLKTGEKGLLELYCEKIDTFYDPNFSLDDILSLLPAYITTNVAEKDAMTMVTKNNKQLKMHFEALFRNQWPLFKEELHKQDRQGPEKREITNYKIVNYEEGTRRVGAGNRTGDESGGLRIMLFNNAAQAKGFFWMRGSKTEPVMRYLVDLKGSRLADERTLLPHLKMLIELANMF